MAKTHGKNAKVLYAQFDHSNYYRNAEVQMDAGLTDSTCFGDGGIKTVPGVRKGMLNLSGIYDGVADAVDERLAADFQTANGKLLSVAPAGSFAVGERVWFGNVRSGVVTPKSPLSDVVSIEAEFAGEAGIFGGLGLHALTAETATGNGTSNDNTASTAYGAVAGLHVTARSGTSPSATVKVQHSTDNSVWVDLITFTAATAVTSEFLSVTGTINRYVRAIWTISGTGPSFTFVVVFARLNN